MIGLDVDPILRSAIRLGQGARELAKTKDNIWVSFLKKESGILLRRVFWLWLKLRLRGK